MIHETLSFSDWFPNTCSKCVLKVDGGSRKEKKRKKKKPCQSCVMFMLDGGNFLCKLSRRFGHQFSQSDCFIVTSCWVWGIYTHLSLRGCFQSRLRIWFYKCFSKIITRPLPAIQNVPGVPLQWALAQLSGKEWGELSPGPTLLRGCAHLPIIDAVFVGPLPAKTLADPACRKLFFCFFCLFFLIVSSFSGARQPAAAATSCEAAERCATAAKVTPRWPADMNAIKTAPENSPGVMMPIFLFADSLSKTSSEEVFSELKEEESC